MGTVINLNAWVVAMINEFTLMSKRYNITFDIVSQAWNIEWKKVNQEIRSDERKTFQSTRGLFHEAFMRVGKRLRLTIKEQDILDSIGRVYNYVNRRAESFPDVPRTLEIIRKEGYKIGIISDADSEDLTVQLRSAGILKYFDMMTTSSEVRSYKPNAKIFEIALAKSKCQPGQACYVGDTPEFDVLGANRVGLQSILVTHGKAKIDLKSTKPAHIIKEVSEVVPLLRELSFP
jgi:putative hydrolase of the HAD superfamily